MKLKKHLLLSALFLLTSLGAWGKNIVAPMTAGNLFLKISDTQSTAPIKLTNYGDGEVTSITYTLYYMDSKQTEGPLTLSLAQPLNEGNTCTVHIPIKPGTTLGKEDIIFNVTQVNNQNNEASVGYTYITRWTVNKVPYKRVLIEDYTDMSCQWCPVGMVATDALVREFPNDVVAVQIHKADELTSLSAYQDGMTSLFARSLPSVWCARTSKISGYDGTSMYESEKNKSTYMNIDVDASWDEAQNNISVTTEVEACIPPEANTTYAVGYVLTASGLKDDNWLQQANYSEYMSDNYKDAPPEMDFYRNPSNYVYDNWYVKGATYNHVAIESQGIKSGIVNSLPGEFKVNEAKTHSTTFNDISRHKAIQDRDQLEVVVILFNTLTNSIENAARCRIKKPQPSFTLSFDQSDWTTLYTDRAYTLPQGVTGYSVTESGELKQVTNDADQQINIAAHTPLLLKGQKGDTYNFNYTDSPTTTIETALRGSLRNELTTTGNDALSNDDVYYYQLTYDADHTNVGFYWAADEGAAFTNPAGHCYLVLPRHKVNDANKQGFALNNNSITHIHQIKNPLPHTSNTQFDAMGRKINTITEPGVYIINGKKVMVK